MSVLLFLVPPSAALVVWMLFGPALAIGAAVFLSALVAILHYKS